MQTAFDDYSCLLSRICSSRMFLMVSVLMITYRRLPLLRRTVASLF